MSTNLEKRVIKECRKYIDLANKTFDLNIKYPEITFDLNTTGAGRSNGNKNLIRFNPHFLEQNVETFLKDTVPHEVAHLVEFARFGTMGHRKPWKEVMRAFGLTKFERCHHYDTTALEGNIRKQATIKYVCVCGTHEISQRRHNKMLSQKLLYKCRKCGNILKQELKNN